MIHLYFSGTIQYRANAIGRNTRNASELNNMLLLYHKKTPDSEIVAVRDL